MSTGPSVRSDGAALLRVEVRRIAAKVGAPVGLLINFGGATLKEGLRRIVNNHTPTTPRLPTPPRRRVR
jgi:hypothetical protein